MNAAGFITALLEDAGNRVLRLDPDTLTALGTLHGRVVCLTFTDLATTVYLQPSESGLRVLNTYAGAPDVTLSGRLPAFARLGLGVQPGLFFSGELVISGDVELGHRFQRVLEGLDIDWEEQLSRVLGDVAAHAIGNALRDARAWTRQAGSILGQDVAEYFTHERRDLPPRSLVEPFLQAVDTLRADVDRLTQRIERLQQVQDR
jgi:ubiquinone biosynthesis accessory factor UbiJ